MLSMFKKKSLASLLANFIKLVEDLRKLAEDKLIEAQKNEAKSKQVIEAAQAEAKAIIAKATAEASNLMADVEAAEVEAEEALAAADKIEEMIGGSAVLEAAAEQL